MYTQRAVRALPGHSKSLLVVGEAAVIVLASVGIWIHSLCIFPCPFIQPISLILSPWETLAMPIGA